MRPFSPRKYSAQSRNDAAQREEIYQQMPLAKMVEPGEKMANMGLWRFNIKRGTVFWSPGVFAIHDLPVSADVDVDNAMAFYPPHHRPILEQAIAKAINEGESYDLELDFISAKGRFKRIRAIGYPEYHNGKATHIVGFFQDNTQRYDLERKLRSAALSDELTGLPNLRHLKLFYEDLGFENAGSKAEPFALFLIELDNLKDIAERHGQAGADMVLKELAERFTIYGNAHCFAARIREDSFALLHRLPGPREELIRFCKGLSASLRASLQFEGEPVNLALSIGGVHRENGSQPFAFIQAEAETVLQGGRMRNTGTCYLASGGERLSLSDF